MKDFKNIEIHVSDYCNRNCSFCVSRFEERGKQMSVKTAIELLGRLGDELPKAVTFSGGGEPTTNNPVLAYLIDGLSAQGVRCGLTTNGYMTATNQYPLEWVRLSVYSPNCKREVENVLATNAKTHNAALFYKGLDDLSKYTFLLDYFDEVTVKTLNNGESPRLTDEDVAAIHAMGFKCKQNPEANDFAECKFSKPCYGVNGEVYKCCLCKAAGGFFGVDKCIVPCVMYNSNKRGERVWNKYGFSI